MIAYDKKRVSALSAYKEKNNDAYTGETLSVPLRGKNVVLKVYRIPLDLLSFNKTNGRLAAQVEQYERTDGELDPATKKGRATIMKMLLELDPDKTEMLESDLIAYGQRDPCVVRADGIAINGNRRMAVLSKLYSAGRGEQFNYLKAGVLDESVTESELFTLEARYQFSTEFRSEYTPVNVLLTIERGLKFNTREAMANDILMLPGGTKELEQKLAVLEVMKDYLARIGHPGEFYLLQKTYSHFAEIPPLLRHLGKTKDDDDVEKYLNIAFKMIKCGVGHRDLRDLKEISKRETAQMDLFEKATGIVELAKPDDTITLKERSDLISAVKTAKTKADEIKDGQRSEVACRKAYNYINELSPKTSDIPPEKIVSLLKDIIELASMKKSNFEEVAKA